MIKISCRWWFERNWYNWRKHHSKSLEENKKNRKGTFPSRQLLPQWIFDTDSSRIDFIIFPLQ